ncbi:MAG: R3H domain-containing nucleic acid-binding protein [Ornithinimicrobium sp.]
MTTTTGSNPAEPTADIAEEETVDASASDDSTVTGETTASEKTTAPDEAAASEGPTAPRSGATDLEREGEVAADFLESLMDIADLDGDLEVDVDGDRAAVSIVDSEDGTVPRRLVGSQASVLEALQELTRLAVQAQTGERSRLILDVGGYRADRRRTLARTAEAAIAEVKTNGQRYALEPMTAFERKVVHDEVLRAGLRSESEGEDPRRFVVVLPAST